MTKIAGFIIVLTNACVLLALCALLYGATVERGRQVYNDQLVAIEREFASDCAACLGYYSNSLAEIELKTRQAADLDGLIAVRGEMERFRSSGSVPDKTPEGIPEAMAVAQSKYQRLVSEALVKRLRKHAALTRSYVKSLEALKVSLVKQGKLDDALSAADELKAAEFILADVEVQLGACDAPSTGSGQAGLRAAREPRPRGSGEKAKMYVSCDNEYVVWLNGKTIGSSSNWHVLACYPIRIAENDILAIEAKDFESGDHKAGLFCGIVIDEDNRSWGTGPDWHCSTTRPPSDWRTSSMLQFDQKMSTENIHPTHRDRERAFLATNQYITGDIVWSPKPSPVVYVKETISFSRFAGGGK
jgi:hypothetical protein